MRLNILAFALGVACLQTVADLPPVWPWLLAGVCLALLAWGLGGENRYRSTVLALACLMWGIAWAAWRADLRLADELPSTWEGRDVTVSGVVAELPQAFANGMRFRFRVETILTAGAAVPQEVMLSWYQGRRDDDDAIWRRVRPGERWQFTVRLKRPHGNANPHGFDYEAWLLERGIRATGYVRPGPTVLVNDSVWRPMLAIERWRDAIRDRFQLWLPPEQYPFAGVLTALAIGDQQSVQGDLWNVFSRTGTTHLMSISGLHVTMVAALLGMAVGWGWRRSERLMLHWPAPKAAIVAGMLAALLYSLLSGYSVPAQRTFYMLAVAALALLSGKNFGSSRILCIALLAVLLFDPWAVLAPGFWLSFAAVAALLHVGLAQASPVPGWKARIAAWGVVQWAATVISLPILLLVFQQFSLVSPLANALAIPVVSFVVTPLALLAVIVPWWGLLWLAHAVMAALMQALDWFATWPVWVAPAPDWWAVLAAVLGAIMLLLPRGVPGKPVGVLLLMPLLFWPAPRPAAGEAWVEVLDVGQGLAVVVRTAEGVLLYDTGPLFSAESDAGQRIIVPYLRALGVDRIDTLIVSHRDKDHSGGLASIRAAMPISRLMSSMPELEGETCRAGTQWSWSGVEFTMLYPTPEDMETNAAKQGKANHVSCVLRVAVGKQRLLLTADIEAADEAALVKRAPEALAADVVLVPHHGSRTSSTEAFLDAVGAKQAVVPVGYRNRFKHPRPDVLARYEARGVRLWRTDRDGALLLRMADDGTEIQAWRQIHRRYWSPVGDDQAGG